MNMLQYIILTIRVFMSNSELSNLISKLISDGNARQSFIEDSEAFVKSRIPEISQDLVDSICTLTDKSIDDLSKGLNVENEKIKIQSVRDDLVEVECACGSGYWYQ